MKKLKSLPRIYIAVLLILMYVPILMVIIYSFNASKIYAVWDGFTLDWYKELFADKSYFEALMNSLVLASTSSVSAAIIGTLGACGMKKVKLRSKGIIEYISTLPIMIPEIILAMVFLAFFSLIGLPFGMTTLIISHTAFCIPYIYMQVSSRLVGLDKSLEESARDLGASNLQAFRDITLPLISPAIASGMLLSFAMSLDDVIISVFVTGVNVNTLPLKIYTQLKTGVSPKVNALCTLMFIATVILCILSVVIQNKSNKRRKLK
ncbi:MAG: ABC transporter permease [Clostridia bacterium]